MQKSLMETEKLIRVVVDTETTGLGPNNKPDPRPDGILQIGIAWRESGSVYTWAKDANPGAEFLTGGRADGALKVNKFTMTRVGRADASAVVAKQLKDQLGVIAERNGGRVVLYAYNAPFDRFFLTQPPWYVTHEWGEDIMARSIRVLGLGGTDRLPLKKAIDLTGIANGNAHDAEGDAQAELKLLEWLDEQENKLQLAANDSKSGYSLEQMAQDIRAHVEKRLGVDFAYPKPQTQTSGAIIWSSTDLDACPLEIWRKAHGLPTKSWALWRMNRGSLGSAVEPVPFEQMRKCGIMVLREGLPSLSDGETGLFGKLDGIIEWPIGSGQLHLADAKSTNAPIALSLQGKIWPKYALQLTAYMMMSGYKDSFFVFYSLDKRDAGKWALRPFAYDQAWADQVLERVAIIKLLRRPEAPQPECSCGFCKTDKPAEEEPSP